MWSSALAVGRSPPDKNSVAYLIRMFRLSFRSEALDELSSPEQLDEAIQVTSPMSWLAGTILLFIVVATLLWSLFGTLRTRVQGDGMITYQDARHIDIVSRHEGYLAELLVRDGDQVARGDVVARLENDVIARRHEHGARTLRAIEREIETLERERDADLDELNRVTEESRNRETSRTTPRKLPDSSSLVVLSDTCACIPGSISSAASPEKNVRTYRPDTWFVIL